MLGTVVAMEAIAFAVHKYVMHGWGWGWHRSHHEPTEGAFETNDLYGLAFAGLALALIVLAPAERGWLYWIGLGMTAYGLLYFVVHDGLVHQRWPFRLVPRNGYLKRLVQAHRLHHAVEGREGGVSFGFLYAPPVRRLKQRLREKHPAGGLGPAERAEP